MKNNTSEKIFVSLLYLSPGFSVTSHYPCEEIGPKTDWIQLSQKAIGITSPEKNEVIDVFKILISTTQFKDYRFFKKGFKFGAISKKGDELRSKKREVLDESDLEDDWFTKRFLIRTVRVQNTINQSDLVFETKNPSTGAKLMLKGHPEFSADISFSPVNNSTKSISHAKNMEKYINNEYAEILEINNANPKSKGANDESIIEFTNIHNKETLRDHPLELILDYKHKENEKIIPVTFDGEFIIPFGESERQDDGTTKVKIDEIPESTSYGRTKKGADDNPFWMRWLKIKGHEEAVFKLRVAKHNNKGKVVRVDQGVPLNVEKAKRILLLIHGIVGNTKLMAKNLMELYHADYYDLILTYDYENLSESIEGIAKKLNERLEHLKLGKDDGKVVDIIAHSMGGLVSRYLIENIRKGDNMIDRLIMVGTPNGGSVFGNVPMWTDVSFKLLTLAVNFGSEWLGDAAEYFDKLKKLNTKDEDGVFNTLQQMDSKSEFIKRLWHNKENGNVEYFVIAGDISNYKSMEKGRLKRFIEKRLLNIGKKAHKNMPNDIAVSVDQIKEIPKEFKHKSYDVSCHHMNYFEEGPAKEILKQLASDRKND